MTMTKKIVLIAVLTALVIPVFALADGPVNLSLFAPVQLVKEDQSVTALRISLIYGKNVDMGGLDLSLVGVNTGSVTGASFTGVGLVDGNFTGWQNSWLASVTQGNMQGVQFGAYNQSGMGSSGFQWGLVNVSDDFSGLQLGLVNITQTMRSGLQIGLINIIQNKEKLKLFPLVNWRF